MHLREVDIETRVFLLLMQIWHLEQQCKKTEESKQTKSNLSEQKVQLIPCY